MEDNDEIDEIVLAGGMLRCRIMSRPVHHMQTSMSYRTVAETWISCQLAGENMQGVFRQNFWKSNTAFYRHLSVLLYCTVFTPISQCLGLRPLSMYKPKFIVFQS